MELSNTKKYLYLFLGVVALAVLSFLVNKLQNTNLLGKEPKLYVYTINSETTGLLSVTVPFAKLANNSYAIEIGLDSNFNGKIEQSELQKKTETVHIQKNLKNNFFLEDAEKKIKSGVPILLNIKLSNLKNSKEVYSIETSVKAEQFEVGDKYGFDVEGSSEDLKRGIGIPQSLVSVARAEESEPVFRNFNTPDLAQGRMECAAVSAANSLMSLAGEHDKLSNLPEFTGDLIEELKTDMKFKNGITLENMVAGKNAFTQRHNLPVSTELKLAPTKEDIIKALNSGAAVELSFAFVQSKSGRKNTGHVVTLVGASNSEIFVHDSGTPEGMDTLRMFGTVQTPKNTFINVPYPLWDGTAFIDGIVIQNWSKPVMAEESYTEAGEQASEVEMLVINGQYFPKSFFRVANPDNCNANHYHAVNQDDTVYGLKSKTSNEIVTLKDQNRSSCGFGKVSEVPVEKITISFQQSQAIISHLPD